MLEVIVEKSMSQFLPFFVQFGLCLHFNYQQ